MLLGTPVSPVETSSAQERGCRRQDSETLCPAYPIQVLVSVWHNVIFLSFSQKSEHGARVIQDASPGEVAIRNSQRLWVCDNILAYN